MIFFTDRDLGSLFPRILSDAGIHVERHDHHFPHNTPDEAWLPEVGGKGWFVISKDKRIRYRPNELNAVMLGGVGLFLVVGHSNHRALAENFVSCLHKVDRFLTKNRPPFIAKVYAQTSEQRQRGSRRTGRVELWLSGQAWLSRS